MTLETDCIPFEEEDTELGKLIAEFCAKRPFEGQGHLYAKEGVHSLLVFTQYGLMSLRKFLAWRKGDKFVKPSRNETCPCGSEKKYKKCCFSYE